MVKTVIKRDGSRVPFESTKISRAVIAAAAEAGFSAEESQAAANRVMSVVIQYTSNQEDIFTDELKNLILDELDESSPAVSKAWRQYDQRNKGIGPDIT